ncbi:UvrD-helicase domain-containing protein [Aeromonas veronii]|nr:UvrD-helicase domain-containing protein [Aeromonas veronii]
MEFTDEQLKYINSSIEKHTFLEACPGSGKTEVVAAKVAKEISSWKKAPGGIAILSFANSATDELANRISKHTNPSKSMYPHFLGTFDSFIYKNIVSPLAIDLTDYAGEGKDASIKIIEPSAFLGYRTKYSYASRGNISAHHFSFDLINEKVLFDTGDSILNRTLSAISLAEWQIKDLFETKLKMLKGGFATYRDIEFLTLNVMKDIKYENFIELLVKRYPLIFIDECQDLSKEQLFILQTLADKGSILHFVGDLHQAIYGFRDVEPAAVKQFTDDNNFEHYKLTRNFRSCQNIVDICAKLTGRHDITGDVSWLYPRCIVVQYSNCPTELIGFFEEKFVGFNKNVILSRGHSILRRFQTTIDELNNIQRLALAIKLYNPNDIDALKNSLQLLSEFIMYHLKESSRSNSFNCPQSISSNIAWRIFLCDSLTYFISSGLNNMNVSWSTWAKSAKSMIRTLSKQGFCSESISMVLAPLDDVNLKSPSGSAKTTVSTSLGPILKSNVEYRKSTIHGAKGETHDVTVVISSATAGNDAHWMNWIKDPNSEAARFAYVASSRPRHYLIWAVKTLKEPEKEILKAIGFCIH